jgi:thioesterase domain-containing protein
VILLENVELYARSRCINFERILDYYVDVIAREQAAPPYYVGGISRGAVVAQAIAARLGRRGKEVGGVFLVDPLIEAVDPRALEALKADPRLSAVERYLVHERLTPAKFLERARAHRGYTLLVKTSPRASAAQLPAYLERYLPRFLAILSEHYDVASAFARGEKWLRSRCEGQLGHCDVAYVDATHFELGLAKHANEIANKISEAMSRCLSSRTADIHAPRAPQTTAPEERYEIEPADVIAMTEVV